MNKAKMLDQIKEHLNLKKDSKFAALLGITPQTFSNWKSRKYFDAELVYAKCKDINPAWLLSGEGEMVRKGESQEILQEKEFLYLKVERMEAMREYIELLEKTNKALKEENDRLNNVISKN
ncbi:helix-turn-helix domain-containing protein [Zhouia sp. PK063]|uniref:helix-turn-helix domain-containing protein n=1 Tax=Zhouia sp. PK063 TaxID=3373602 RepID=UPI003794A6FC